MNGLDHSVTLLEDKCIGCTDCIKRCPTEAIRIRNGKAIIMGEKCIDCGMCIQVCDHHAKKATTQSIKIIENFKYKVAIPAPALYAQFKNLKDVNTILTAIKRMGFDDVFEVSAAAEMVTEYTKTMLSERKLKKPVISSACPAIVRLICMRFPSLIENILPVIAPIEVAAIAVKNDLTAKGMPREDIGVFFISPCASKNTYVANPIGVEKSQIDGVISMGDIYMDLMYRMRNLKEIEHLVQSTDKGVDWAISGGESKGVDTGNAIAVDGVDNVIMVLEELENGQLEDVDFIEGLACVMGCVGGPLTMINGFVAKNRLRMVEKRMKLIPPEEKRTINWNEGHIPFEFTKELQPVGALKLDDDMMEALRKMAEIEAIYEKLPRIDCSSCGSPTCRAMAEDIVMGKSNMEECVFMLREKIKELAVDMMDMAAKMPQTLSSKK